MEIERESTLEKRLSSEIKKLGGWSLKMLSNHISGLPDRVVLLPGGLIFFAEIKTTKEKPRKIQRVIHAKLRRMGFRVEVIDNSKQITDIIKSYA